jgi:ubiquinone/menaquinone biosynthesis C-methylase UbiE
MNQWYEKLFENYSQKYDDEVFTQGTLGECDFIEKELNFDKSLYMIDIGCGTGRHSIELTKRGYSIIGIDLSEGQLRRAREKPRAINSISISNSRMPEIYPLKKSLTRQLCFAKAGSH